MELNLSGKNALVCGASKGIGRAAAEELARLGANVILLSRSESSLKEVMGSLEKQGKQQHDYISADHSKPAELDRKVRAYIKENATNIHILVNNSGGPPGGPIVDAKIEEFEDAFRNHLVCNHLLAQAVLEGMRKDGYGRIINVISTSVKQPLNGLGVSNTIRGAVANWSKTWANEVGQYGITVNNVLPGATETERLSSIIEKKSGASGSSIDEVSRKMQSAIPLDRFAEAWELGAAIAFLASPSAAYISGINLPVDGGRLSTL